MIAVGAKPVAAADRVRLPAALRVYRASAAVRTFERRNSGHHIHYGLHTFIDGSEDRMVTHKSERPDGPGCVSSHHLLDAAVVVARMLVMFFRVCQNRKRPRECGFP